MINASINTPAKISAKSLVIGDVSKRSLGLDAVDNTSDLDKPISTAQQTAIDLKANQATTYTKAEVDNNIANLVDTAPAALDTLNELAAALGDDENFATTVNSLIALKAPLASPAFTGGATIDGADILHLNNIGIEVQPWSTILDDTTASFTTAIALAITDNSSNISTLNDDNTVDGSVAFAVKALADGAVATNSADIAANYLATPHNTNSVIICNDGDNIQDKYDEAVALATGNGYADLIVMSGIYPRGSNHSAIMGTGNNNVSIIGVGNRDHIQIDGILLDQNYGLITNVNSNISITSNYADIKGVKSGSYFYMLENYVDIIDCSAPTFLSNVENYGLIEGCKSTGTVRGFGGFGGSLNDGTIKNCTASGEFSFGQQNINGVTENCVGGEKAFAASSNQIIFDVDGFGVRGTYKNCTAGIKSFFGANETSGIKTVDANFYNCTAGVNSFGFVNFLNAETHFSGKAIGCTSGNNGFFRAFNGSTKILDGAVIENCVGGFRSFAYGVNASNEGVIVRCRAATFGADAFSAIGDGKVRLCLDADYSIVNIPATAWPT
jgi:hypothetical protein